MDPNNPQNQQSSASQPLGQVSSSDAPPIPPDVHPVSDAASPQPTKIMENPGYVSYQQTPAQPTAPAANATPFPFVTPPQQQQVAPPPVQAPPPQQPTITNRSNPLKKILLIGGILAGLLLGVLLVVRFVLPLINQEGGVKEREIVWWGLWEDEQIVASVINDYQQANPGVKITYVPQSKENYRERLTSAIARGDGPDIFRYHNTWVPMFRDELSVAPTEVITQAQFSQIYYPVMVKDLVAKEGVIGLPLEYDGLALFINDDIFTNFGKTPPETWNEFQTVAKELTVVDQNGLIRQSGAALGITENVDHWQEILGLIMLQNGVNLNSLQSLSSGNAAQALKFYTDFTTESEIWDDTLPNSTVAFASGQVAMYFAPSWRVFEIQHLNPELNFRVVPVPQIPQEDTTQPDITYATYWAEGVAEQSSEKDIAWDFLKFMSEKEQLQSFYEAASLVRLFGEPYPRQDMRSLLLDAPKVGGFIQLAPNAQSWYLASRTWDGSTGLNTRINQYFEDAINGMVSDRGSNDPEELMLAVTEGVKEVFAQYGLGTR